MRITISREELRQLLLLDDIEDLKISPDGGLVLYIPGRSTPRFLVTSGHTEGGVFFHLEEQSGPHPHEHEVVEPVRGACEG